MLIHSVTRATCTCAVATTPQPHDFFHLVGSEIQVRQNGGMCSIPITYGLETLGRKIQASFIYYATREVWVLAKCSLPLPNSPELQVLRPDRVPPEYSRISI